MPLLASLHVQHPPRLLRPDPLADLYEAWVPQHPQVLTVGTTRSEALSALRERLAEEVHGYLDQVERKRASTAASASRLKGNGPEAVNVGQLSRAEQIAWARSRG